MNYAPHCAKVFFRHIGSLVQQHHVTELNLLDHQALQVILLNILFRQCLPAIEFILHSESIDYRHYAVQTRNVILGIWRDQVRHHINSLRDRGRLANPACLDDYVIEFSGNA